MLADLHDKKNPFKKRRAQTQKKNRCGTLSIFTPYFSLINYSGGADGHNIKVCDTTLFFSTYEKKNYDDAIDDLSTPLHYY